MINELTIFVFIAVLGTYYLAFYLGMKHSSHEIKVSMSYDKELEKRIIELETLRLLDNEVIEDLQKKLRDNGLDDSIG